MNFSTEIVKNKEVFEPVKIHLTFNSFDDLQTFYKMIDKYKDDIFPKGVSGWSNLYAVIKNHLIDSLLI